MAVSERNATAIFLFWDIGGSFHSSFVSVFFGFFSLPLLRNASLMIHWSCPLVLRNSSAAHFSMASIVAASTRKTKLLVVFSFFAIGGPFLINDSGYLYSIPAGQIRRHKVQRAGCSPWRLFSLRPVRLFLPGTVCRVPCEPSIRLLLQFSLSH